MSLPYVRIENQEKLEALREVLYSEISILNMTKKLREYKRYRRIELLKKASLRKKIRECKLKVNFLLEILPSITAQHYKTKKEIEVEAKKFSDIELEVAEIRSKLARLS